MKITTTMAVLFGATLALAGCGGGGQQGNAAGNAAAPAANAAAPAAAPSNESDDNASEGTSEAQPAATGAQQDFTIVNNTGHTVMTLNVSPSDQNSWGPDILGSGVLPNGQQGQVQFARGQEQCNWDIRATFDNNESGDWRNVNLCETTTITLTAE